MLAAAGKTGHIQQDHSLSSALKPLYIPTSMLQGYKPATPENHRADVIFLRDYSEGIMQRETVLRVADKDAQRKALKAVAKEQKRTDKKASQKVSLVQAARAQSAVWAQSAVNSEQPPHHLAGVWRVRTDGKLLHHQP